MKRLLCILLLSTVCIAGAMEEPEGEESGEQELEEFLNAENLLAIQQKTLELSKEALINFQAQNYATIKKLRKRYVDDLEKNEKEVTELWDNFLNKNINQFQDATLKAIEEVIEVELDLKDEEGVSEFSSTFFPTFRDATLTIMKLSFVISSKAYKRYKEMKQLEENLDLIKFDDDTT